MYKEFLNEINDHEIIIIYRHKKPDGDALGSQFGLKELITDNFKNKKVFIVGDNKEFSSNYLKNIFKEEFNNVTEENFKDALLIIVDTANLERIEGINSFLGIENKVVKIDHHVSSEDYGDIKIIYEKYSSTSEIISEVAEKLDWTISKKASKYLLTGIITDSGRFMFNSVSSNTFHQASLLMLSGAKPSNITGLLNSRDVKFSRLQGKILSNFSIDNNVASYMMPKNTHKKYGVNYDTASSMIFLLMGSKEIKYGLFSSYDSVNKIWKTSIRSKDKPINQLAEKYGGGGHKMASGIKLKNKNEFKEIKRELINLSK